MGIKRAAEELWIDYEARSLRIARAKVHQLQQTRWGDKRLTAFWQYTGHLVREGHKERPSVAGVLANFRPLTWWEQQQQGSEGVKHHRHFLRLMNTERKLAKVTGSSAWRVATMNRVQWKGLEKAWIQQESIPWSSGRQPALTA